jgi:3-hydroxyisobutyrate dehydrogenase
MKVGFIGLGNVGGKLANSLLRNKFDLTVIDLDFSLTKDFCYQFSERISPKS